MKTNREKSKQIKITRRANRVRAKFFGTAEKPRLSVFKSLKHVSAQLINDEQGKTMVSFNDAKMKGKKIENAKKVGQEIAKLALAKGIKECVFDRGRFKYHGIIKELAEGAREGGLQF
jgi:large subunit ribosomal protein L18